MFGDNSGIVFISFLLNICCGYSLEVPCRGTSNEYPQHVFWKKIIPELSFHTLPLQELCISKNSTDYDPTAEICILIWARVACLWYSAPNCNSEVHFVHTTYKCLGDRVVRVRS